DCEFSFAVRAAAAPDPPDDPPFVAQPSPSGVIAAVGHDRTRRTAEATNEGAPRACPPRRVEEHDGVCALEPQVKGGVVVAVGDPFVSGEQASVLLAP